MVVVADTSVLVAELLRERGRALLAHPGLRVVVAEEQWAETEHELQRRLLRSPGRGARSPILWTSQTEIRPDGVFDPGHLGLVQAPSAPPQGRLRDRVQVGGVDEAFLVLAQPCLAADRHMRTGRPCRACHQRGGHGPEPGDHRIDRQHDEWVHSCPCHAGVPDFAPERFHP